ncbi:F0F1 ATP synthase subunit A [Hyphomicrobium sulfonivorans]|uniref:ATP synthase subunit a n=1 Tax=Hyphomicrobium sulfonivorans TaxID=121290 RepID=A0A109B949_HYPSL|nr:F0F1 ATP synthase subunit A [Hyphomicrobium sulfonivorans]KWT64359.1 ATP synthase A chain [Hyphomicrobium sulfonivorans]MBI1649427.1 F0F1 ATP synthase subunit A [Hyphomicrobium sulfonivorans]NSL71344.1 F0F1 ATP synthase subunit A [Hyphomicrobium sulfonivorans]
MEQFEIKRIIPLELFGWDISFTNASLFMVLAVVLIPLFYLFAMNRRALVPGRLQSIAELSYEFIANMIKDIVGEGGMKYFPWIFTIFMFILTVNMLGLLPYSFTVTSHIIVTFALAAMVWLVITAIGFMNHGPGFLKLFVPSGVPFWLLPIIVVIELISYLIRPISHSVRLFANMMAGHAMLKVFAGFVVGLGVLGGWAPLVFLVGFTGLELVVAFLQAFIFTVLTCIYLNDAVNMHEH